MYDVSDATKTGGRILRERRKVYRIDRQGNESLHDHPRPVQHDRRHLPCAPAFAPLYPLTAATPFPARKHREPNRGFHVKAAGLVYGAHRGSTSRRTARQRPRVSPIRKYFIPDAPRAHASPIEPLLAERTIAR